MTELEIVVTGNAAKVIETIRCLTGKREPMEVIINALRVSDWILAEEATGCIISSQRLHESSAEGSQSSK